MLDLLVFVFTVLGARLRQKTLLHEVAEQFRIGAVGKAEQVVEALRRRAMRVGKLLRRPRSFLRRYLVLVGIGSAEDQAAGFSLVEMERHIGRDLIGGVLLAAEHRHLVHIEQCMREFMQSGIEQGPNDGVYGRCVGPRRVGGRALPQLVEIFVANRYGVIFIGCVGVAVTPLQRHRQLARQAEWTEEFPQHLKRPLLLKALVDPPMDGVAGHRVFDLDLVGLIPGVRSHSVLGTETLWDVWTAIDSNSDLVASTGCRRNRCCCCGSCCCCSCCCCSCCCCSCCCRASGSGFRTVSVSKNSPKTARARTAETNMATANMATAKSGLMVAPVRHQQQIYSLRFPRQKNEVPRPPPACRRIESKRLPATGMKTPLEWRIHDLALVVPAQTGQPGNSMPSVSANRAIAARYASARNTSEVGACASLGRRTNTATLSRLTFLCIRNLRQRHRTCGVDA